MSGLEPMQGWLRNRLKTLALAGALGQRATPAPLTLKRGGAATDTAGTAQDRQIPPSHD
ncbi:MAG: hypothetical protein WCD42_08870 [Rhizomicrobium sp.]